VTIGTISRFGLRGFANSRYERSVIRVTGELTALVGARVMEEHRHPALAEQFTVQEGALSILRFGGREGIRTPGLLVANEALSQLSYSPSYAGC
jgi:hypothetical protein